MRKTVMLLAALCIVCTVPGFATPTEEELVKEGWVKNPEQNGYLRMLPDAVSSATETMTGVAAKQMPPELVKTYIFDFLKGYEKDPQGEYNFREMYQIATARNNVPLISSVEFVLDREHMRLYAVSEKDTEKVRQIADNPAVALYWVKQIGEENAKNFPMGYFSSRGVQIKGRARIVPADDPEVMHILNLYMPTTPRTPGAPVWNPADSARIQRLLTAQRIIEIIPDSFMVTNTDWAFDKRGFHYQQVLKP